MPDEDGGGSGSVVESNFVNDNPYINRGSASKIPTIVEDHPAHGYKLNH